MRGIPNHLNTKTDYLFLKDNYDRSYWEQVFQNLLDTTNDWFMIDEKDYIKDEFHKKVYNEENDTYEYFEYRENPNALIFQLGFTVGEVENILKE